ncbi:HEPN domain-containing protein [Burkholderia sp. SCN-KJ]|uniref:HEPN domain-containing protein n=1 Tax=Burkholderia sp. SCN-KJ TaxID=2969248 RepID=UPI0021503A0F|nr:HEPN domain-containing protein [Burkholderia sp. SCN-KJ]MCR4470402.1 HEPN domain-containing protein [Burkholderia sp. SCN-KJ]
MQNTTAVRFSGLSGRPSAYVGLRCSACGASGKPGRDRKERKNDEQKPAMKKMPISVHSMFEACTLNREIYRDLPNAIYAPPEIVDINDPEKFDDAIAQFLASEEGKHLSQEGLLRLIRRSLVECKEFCDSLIAARIESFSNKLKSLPLVDYKVVKSFHGVTINGSDVPVKFGSLVVYELPRHVDEIAKLLPWADHSGIRDEKHKRTVIECSTKARDEVKALELANTVFNAFDLLIAFLLSEKYTDRSLGILRMNFASRQDAIISTRGGIFSGDEARNLPNDLLDISNLSMFLPNGREGMLDQFLDIVISPKNDLEKRISKAVEWTGEAYSDSNRSSAYLKTVIALEALLKIDEKGIITPSIMSSIAEQCAYLNGRSIEECLAIERKVKVLYGRRSKIAHTGSTSVSAKDLRETRAFVRDTIWNFIHLAKKLNLSSVDAFQSTLRQRKYRDGGL